MNMRKVAALGVGLIVIAAVTIQFLSPMIFGEDIDFHMNAVLGAEEEERYILVFIDNVGARSLMVTEIFVEQDRVFPGRAVDISVNGGPTQTKDQISLDVKEKCLVRLDVPWGLGVDYDVKVSASASDGALIPKVKSIQAVLKAPSVLTENRLVRLDSLTTSKEDIGALSASFLVEANDLDWVRVMLFTHFTSAWPGYRPVKFYYDPVFNNSAVGGEPEIMAYYQKVGQTLASAGIAVELIDSFGLWNTMIEMQPAVVIMGVDILPKFGNPPVWYGEENQQSLAARWLKIGGVLIWIGDELAVYYGEPSNGSRMNIPGEEPWQSGPVVRGKGDWWLLGYDPIEVGREIGVIGGFINMPVKPTRAGRTLGLETEHVDRPVLLKGKRPGPEVPANVYLYSRYEDRLKELDWSMVAYLPASNGTGGVWYIGVYESAPARYEMIVEAGHPSWDDMINDVAWDTAMAVIHSVWTGLTAQGDKDTAHIYFEPNKGYIGGEIALSTLPLSYPDDLNTVTVRLVAVGYNSETQQYFYDEMAASIPV